jgi:flagellar biosynthesis protein FliR
MLSLQLGLEADAEQPHPTPVRQLPNIMSIALGVHCNCMPPLHLYFHSFAFTMVCSIYLCCMRLSQLLDLAPAWSKALDRIPG